MEMARALASREALANGTLQLPAAALVELRKRKAADEAAAAAERRAMAAVAATALGEDEDDEALELEAAAAASASMPITAAESARLHDFALERMVAGAERLQLSALRLEHTLLLLRELHYTSVPRLAGRDVLDVELANVKK